MLRFKSRLDITTLIDLIKVFSFSALNNGVTVLVNILAARQLGPINYGLFSFYITLSQSVSLIGDLGLSTTIVSYWSKAEESTKRQYQLLYGFVIAQLMILATIFLCAIPGSKLLNQIKPDYPWQIVALSVVTGALLLTWRWITAFLQSTRQFSWLSVNLFFQGFLKLSGLVVVCFLNRHLITEWIIAIIGLPVSLLLGLNWLHLREWFLSAHRPHWREAIEMVPFLFSYSKWVAIASIAYNMAVNIPRFFLAILATPQELGKFSLGMTFTMFFALINTSARYILFPYITRQNSTLAIRNTLRILLKRFPFYVAFVLAIITVLVTLQRFILSLEYEGALGIFIITSLSLAFTIYIGIGTMSWHALLIPQVDAITNLVRFGLITVLSWILIPLAGATGAALAYAVPIVLGETIQLVYLHHFLNQYGTHDPSK